jgi:hypothetical protein
MTKQESHVIHQVSLDLSDIGAGLQASHGASVDLPVALLEGVRDRLSSLLEGYRRDVVRDTVGVHVAQD